MRGFQRIIKIFAIGFGVAIIANIFMAIISVLSLITNIGDRDTAVLQNDFVETYSMVEEIYIDSSTSTIVIKNGNEFKVEASNINDNISSEFKNGILKIKEKEKWFSNNMFSETITIYVPENEFLKKIEVEADVGEMYIDGIKAEILNLSQGAGILIISNSEFSRTNIEGGTGSIDITTSKLNDLEFESGVGKVEMQAQITGKSNISVGIGAMNISLIGNKEEYSITSKKGIGSIKIDNKDCSSDTVYGNGENIIKLEGGIGSIVIDFEQ